MDDIKIKFQGFTPSEFTQAYFREVLQRLHEEAPATSFMKATVSKVRDQFRAVVQINSPAGHFFAAATSPKVTDLGQQLVSKMHRQLDKWKTLRRSRETIRGKYGSSCDRAS
jgi:ribosome-associated translation inhibitor RaiA